MSYRGTKTAYTKHLTVDWDSIIFKPERKITIQAHKIDSPNGLCLYGRSALAQTYAGRVTLRGCKKYNKGQIWGMDDLQRIKNLRVSNQCLANTDGKVTLEACSASARQKWSWNEGKLTSQLGGNLVVGSDQRTVYVSEDSGLSDQWGAYKASINASKAIGL